MKAHGLMQAIARVNRVYKDKPGGLVVDYLGVAEELRRATATYTQSGGKGKPVSYQDDAVALMEEKYEIVKDFFHGFNYKEFFRAGPGRKMELIPMAMEHVLKHKNGKMRYLKYVSALSRAFALAAPAKEALRISDDVGFFQAIRAGLSKSTNEKGKSKEDLESAINQIISKSIATKGVIDIFEVSGLKKPEISVFSEEFLKELQLMEHKNLALEALRRLLYDEIGVVCRKNIIEGRKFSEILEKSMRRYQNRSIDAAKIVAELIELAKEIKESKERGEKLGLTEDELAFYDALADNESARTEMPDEMLRTIAREIAGIISKNASIDWEIKESVRYKLKVLVRRRLKVRGYPPDKRESAADLVLKQAELTAKKKLEENP